MKKLGKLSIKPETIIKNEELMNLRGGYNGYNYDGYGDCFLRCRQDSSETVEVASCNNLAELVAEHCSDSDHPSCAC